MYLRRDTPCVCHVVNTFLFKVYYKYLKQLEKKKRETGGHKGQNSNLSEIVKNTRLKTEVSDKKKPKN